MVKSAEDCDDNWLYSYDRTKPISSQTVYNHPKASIVNVSKIFTNNRYFGINIFISRDKQIYRLIRCKDASGCTEEAIKDKEFIIKILTRYLDNLDSPSHSIKDNWVNVTPRTVDITLASVNNHVPIVQFCYKDNTYAFTNILIGDTVNRSLYAAEDINSLESYLQKTHIPKGEEPTLPRVKQFYEDTKVALSNVYTYVNTEYSQIKVYRKIIIK
jgi:hypothetical protein